MKYLTTRICNIRELQKVWVYRTKKGIFSGVTSSFRDYGEPDVIHNGQKWIKPPKDGELVELSDRSQSYEKLLELVQKYDYKIVGQLLGWDLNSFGDVYNFYFLAGFQTYGQKYVDYLNKIAEIDFKIEQFLLKNKVLFSNLSNYYCLNVNKDWVKAYPFVGQNMECALYSIPIPPSIDVIKLNDSLELILNLCGFDVSEMCLWDMIEKVADKESIEWLKNNIEIS